MKKLLLLILISTISISETLNLSISSNPARLNPLIATDSTSSEITRWIFDSLVKYDKNAKIVPHIAKSYKFLDKTTLLFDIRDDVFFSDGVQLTADDVVFTYELLVSDKIFTPYASSFRFVESVKKIDKFKVEIKYTKPYYKALEIWLLDILPKHKLESEKDIMTSEFNKKPIGTGSYTLKRLKNSEKIELELNKNYFLKNADIENIVYKFIPNRNTNFLMLKAKKIDLLSLNPIQLAKQIDKNFLKDFNIVRSDGQSYTYVGFNLKLKKFSDIRVREAINLAIDKKEIIDILFFGYAKECNGPFLKGSFAYNENIKSPKQNLLKAKKLLEEAGFNDKNPLEFELITNSNNNLRVYVSQIIQHQLSKIGVKVKIKAIEWQAFLNTVIHPRAFEAIVLGWSLPLMPSAYSIWHSKSDFMGGFNFVSYKNEKVDRLIEKAEEEIDIEKLSKTYKEIFKLIVEDYPYIFLYVPDSVRAIDKKIKNVEDSITGIWHNQRDWKIEK